MKDLLNSEDVLVIRCSPNGNKTNILFEKIQLFIYWKHFLEVCFMKRERAEWPKSSKK